MEREKQWLEECRKLIELSLSWGNSSLWGKDDFERLSEKIWVKTRIRLSVSTLKRIWGRVPYKNFPNSATLNALVGFLDYDHWRDFCQAHPVDQERQSFHPSINFVPPKKSGILNTVPQKSTLRKVLLVVIILGVCSWLVLKFFMRERPLDAAGFSFSSRTVTDDLPNSVVFNYRVGYANNSRFMIQQSWDTSKREIINGNAYTHSSLYYYPGYFKAKLLVNDRIVKETPVFIQTKGWKGIIGKKPVPIYLTAEEIRQNSGIGVSDILLKEKLNTAEFNGARVQFNNIREFPGIDAGDFTLETVFRNSSTVEESLCRRVVVEILGTENVIMIPFSTLGCIAELELFTGDSLFLAKEHDLSAFGCDFSHLQQLKCTVDKQLLKIYLNKMLIMTAPQKNSLGRIVGLRVVFEGAGQVQQVMLQTPGKIAYDLAEY